MMSPTDRHLTAWGWDTGFEEVFATHRAAGLEPGRVVTAAGSEYRVVTVRGDVGAIASGRLRHAASTPEDLPAAGDWVALEDEGGAEDRRIAAVLPRRSAFLRHAPGRRTEAQVLAANVDTVFLVAALTRDLNPRRMERYLGAAWASGASPVVVLNKADLCADIGSALRRIEGVAPGVPVVAVSAVAGDGLDRLAPHLVPGRTVALLGSSGVGKSTLVNALLGEERQSVRATREDDERGRHTTTSRELIPLPGGSLILDTPGMRSLALWDDEGIERAFADIEALAAACRFDDCAHDREPGCAVRSAIDAGELPGARLESRRKLERELHALERRTTPTSHAAARRSGRLRKRAAEEALTRKRGSSSKWEE